MKIFYPSAMQQSRNELSFSKPPTLGDPDTLLLHPATSSHINVDAKIRKETGITDSLVRLSIGLEDPGDLIEELFLAGKNLSTQG